MKEKQKTLINRQKTSKKQKDHLSSSTTIKKTQSLWRCIYCNKEFSTLPNTQNNECEKSSEGLHELKLNEE